MFHRFSIRPAKSRVARASALGRGEDHNHDAGNTNQGQTPAVLRPKTAKACERCRTRRIKCSEEKPCTHCVKAEVECSLASNETSGIHTDRHLSKAPTRVDRSLQPSSATREVLSTGQPRFEGVRDDTAAESLPSVQKSAGDLRSAGHSPAFPPPPHPTLPSEDAICAPDALSEGLRRYCLRVFWESCHPLVQIMKESDFAVLYSLPSSSMLEKYSTKEALVDSMLALAIQHIHCTGLAGRILGIEHLKPSSDHQADWPGFKHFERCRYHLGTHIETTVEALRSYILIILYLIQGNAFQHAYGLIGIAVRQAYFINLNELPPSALPNSERTGRMQLWWALYRMDLNCSLQLAVPANIQKSAAKCPLPFESALACFLSPSDHPGELNPHIFSTHSSKLAIILADICAIAASVGADDTVGQASTILEQHALKLTSALNEIEMWRNRLPSELHFGFRDDTGDENKVSKSAGEMSHRAWPLRRGVLLELQYHNAYILAQRPFIRLLHSHITPASLDDLQRKQFHIGQHIFSAAQHSIAIVERVYSICSLSDTFYGCSEVLQSLWNAALTLVAFVYIEPCSALVPSALESLLHAKAVFKLFSSASASACLTSNVFQDLACNIHGIGQ